MNYTRQKIWRIKISKLKGTTMSRGKKHDLDKFYTKPEIAEYFIKKAKINKYNVIIEPSAGSGSFSNQIEDCIALDLEPESDKIIKQDFFTYTYNKDKEKVLVIGNPPFGKQNNLAIAFINYAAQFADRVAFILPLSFKKESVQNRLNKNLHLTYEEDVPKNSFTLDGIDYDVKCVFQIWDVKKEERLIDSGSVSKSNNLFSYVSKSDNPDAAIQRVGGNAGKATLDWRNKSESSNYFIKFNKKVNLNKTIKAINSIVFSSKDYTVGPRSISKKELNLEINKL
jgi:predicted RNA methylase